MNDSSLDSEYWNNRYVNNETGWDISMISRPIKEYLDQYSNKSDKVLIPGAGNAHEAEYASRIGFNNVHILDFAESPIEKFKNAHPQFTSEHIHCEDFFLHDSKYDLILEQTFFCAINPSLRKNYAEKMHSLLKKNGKLVGLLFDTNFEGGPPFGGNKEEYLDYFSPLFNIKTFDKCYNSINPRAGRELFVILIRK